jgi:hypothetical protein
MCQPNVDYQKINPNVELMIIGECKDGCDNVVVNHYHFTIFKQWIIGSEIRWIECISNHSSKKLIKSIFSCLI